MSIERIIAGFMRAGAFAAVLVTLAGVFLLAAHGDLPTADGLRALSGARCLDLCASLPGGVVTLAGLIALVGVSVGRLLLCAVLFLHEGDPHYAVVSLVTVVLVAAAVAFRLAGA